MMKRTATYFKNFQANETFQVEYDDEQPCRGCGEPVISSSMGGTDLCPWCDMGKCRYCGIIIMGTREEILKHMKWHRERDPDFNSKLLESHRWTGTLPLEHNQSVTDWNPFKITYVDWYGTEITESVGDMISRINTLEKIEAQLRERLTKLGET